MLGLSIGTITGSKTILEIPNRLGHSMNYKSVKNIETEFSYSYQRSGHKVPDESSLKHHLCLVLAWDNYDVNIDTLDGKASLHITVGIIYQNHRRIYEIRTVFPTSSSCIYDKEDIQPYYKNLKAKFDLKVFLLIHLNLSD